MSNLLGSFEVEKLDTFMNTLINGHCLKVNEKEYFFEEVELYFNSIEHRDCSVIKRIQKAGEILFHSYGFDICFDSNEVMYGGVLIRSLLENGINKPINGPRNCLLEILNTHTKNGLKIELKQCEKNRNLKLLKSKRIKGIWKKDSKDEEFYRYTTVQNKGYITKNGSYDYKKKTNNLVHIEVN